MAVVPCYKGQSDSSAHGDPSVSCAHELDLFRLVLAVVVAVVAVELAAGLVAGLIVLMAARPRALGDSRVRHYGVDVRALKTIRGPRRARDGRGGMKARRALSSARDICDARTTRGGRVVSREVATAPLVSPVTSCLQHGHPSGRLRDLAKSRAEARDVHMINTTTDV